MHSLEDVWNQEPDAAEQENCWNYPHQLKINFCIGIFKFIYWAYQRLPFSPILFLNFPDHLLQAGKALADQPEGCQGEYIGGSGHVELLHLFQPERERESGNKKLPPKLTNLVMEEMLSTLGLCRCSASRWTGSSTQRAPATWPRNKVVWCHYPPVPCLRYYLGKNYGLTLPYTWAHRLQTSITAPSSVWFSQEKTLEIKVQWSSYMRNIQDRSPATSSSSSLGRSVIMIFPILSLSTEQLKCATCLAIGWFCKQRFHIFISILPRQLGRLWNFIPCCLKRSVFLDWLALCSSSRWLCSPFSHRRRYWPVSFQLPRVII